MRLVIQPASITRQANVGASRFQSLTRSCRNCLLLVASTTSSSSVSTRRLFVSSTFRLEGSGKTENYDTSKSKRTTPIIPRIPTYILGAGSLGLVWAASLRLAFPSYPVRLLLRNNRAHMVDRKTKTVQVCYQQQKQQQTQRGQQIGQPQAHKNNVNNKNRRLTSPRLIPIPAEIISCTPNHGGNNNNKIQTLILTTKAYQAKDALLSIQHRLSSQTRIILLLNGALAVREQLLTVNGLDKCQYCLAWTTQGAYQQPKKQSKPFQQQQHQSSPSSSTDSSGVLEEEGTNDSESNNDTDQSFTMMPFYHVVHAGTSGRTCVEEFPELSDLWNQAGTLGLCESVSKKEIQRQLWLKLAANCAINPLTAVYRCTNGELLQKLSDGGKFTFAKDITLQEETLTMVVQKLVEEVISVAESKGVIGLTLDQTLEFVYQVLRDTAPNYSSMLQDVLQNKRRTEIDFLNGYVVHQGHQMGIACPIHEELCHAVQKLTT